MRSAIVIGFVGAAAAGLFALLKRSAAQPPAPRTPAPRTPAPRTPAPRTPAPRTPAPRTPAPTPRPAPPSENGFHFSAASLANLRGVHPEMVAVAEQALRTGPQDFAVTSGLRTVEEQQRAADKGVSKCDPSKGCIGKHTLGRALDLTPIVNGRAELDDAQKVRSLAPQIQSAADALGVPVKWLGDSQEFPDPFHWELTSVVGAPSVNGYRRAQQSEVDARMTAEATAALVHNLGDVRGPFVNTRGQRFKVLLERHSNAPKGASVFLEDTAGVA